MRPMIIESECCLMYWRSYVKPNDSDLKTPIWMRELYVCILLIILLFQLSEVLNCVKYSDFYSGFLFKYFRHIRSYEQFINKYYFSFFLLFSLIFYHFHFFCGPS